jgi:glycosyltransferase involved in cell wall biosynthesis
VGGREAHVTGATGGPGTTGRPLRVLFVSPYVPSEVRVRPYAWIRQLAAQGHEVSLFALGGPDDRAAVDEMRRLCHHVAVFRQPAWRPFANCAAVLVGRDPFQRAWSRLPALSEALQRAVAERSFDVAHIEHLRGSCFAPDLTPLPVVYDAVDSISLLFDQTSTQGPRFTHRLMARLDRSRTAQFESTLLDNFSAVIVSSNVDADRFRLLAGKRPDIDRRLIVLPHPVDLARFRPTADARDEATIIFSGKMSYHANIAAAQVLVHEVMPLVWKQAPAARVLIVGQAPDGSVRHLARDARVTVTGRVPEIATWLAKATIAVCPMRYGVGVQNKVLEAMAAGVPVVVTRQGAAGLDAEPGRDLVVCDGIEEMAAATLRLLASPDTRATLASNARGYVERHRHPAALGQKLVAVYQRAISAPAAV